jgi:hypothetical protein
MSNDECKTEDRYQISDDRYQMTDIRLQIASYQRQKYNQFPIPNYQLLFLVAAFVFVFAFFVPPQAEY